MANVLTYGNQIRWLSVYNTSGEQIPAFGLIRVTGADSVGVLQAAKPNADGQQVMVNGPVPIPVAAYGSATNDFPNYALYDTGDGTPAVGDTWGAGSGSWKLRKNKAGFRPQAGAVPSSGLTIVALAAGSTPPFSGCRLTCASDPNVAANTDFEIPWDTAIFDTDSYLQSNRMVIPATGYYLLGAAVDLGTSSGPEAGLVMSMSVIEDPDGGYNLMEFTQHMDEASIALSSNQYRFQLRVTNPRHYTAGNVLAVFVNWASGGSGNGKLNSDLAFWAYRLDP